MVAIVCYSGGHSSALVAVEAVRRYGNENVILLNHDISSAVEHEDIKRFKREVADYLGVPVTYCNHSDFENTTPLEVCRQKKGFHSGNHQCFCTHVLKTKPFVAWLGENYPVGIDGSRDDVVILYGFDASETGRIDRRAEHIAALGYRTEFPLAHWKRTIYEIEEIGIKRPITYERYKHANCIGCLKAGKQHWYTVFCDRPDIFDDAKRAEAEIGHSIVKSGYLKDFEPLFRQMRDEMGIVPTDKGVPATFWAQVRRILKDDDDMPCTA